MIIKEAFLQQHPTHAGTLRAVNALNKSLPSRNATHPAVIEGLFRAVDHLQVAQYYDQALLPASRQSRALPFNTYPALPAWTIPVGQALKGQGLLEEVSAPNIGQSAPGYYRTNPAALALSQDYVRLERVALEEGLDVDMTNPEVLRHLATTQELYDHQPVHPTSRIHLAHLALCTAVLGDPNILTNTIANLADSVS